MIFCEQEGESNCLEAVPARGETTYLRRVFHNVVVPIKNGCTVFVHEEDNNEHLVFRFETGDEDASIRSTGFAQQFPLAQKIG